MIHETPFHHHFSIPISVRNQINRRVGYAVTHFLDASNYPYSGLRLLDCHYEGHFALRRAQMKLSGGTNVPPSYSPKVSPMSGGPVSVASHFSATSNA